MSDDPTGDQAARPGHADGVEILGPDECRALLASAAVGRVAVTIGAMPAVLPVNFAVFDGDVVFRTGRGTKLDAALQRTVVAFEADEFDPVYHTGWSVMVVGMAGEIGEEADLERARHLALRPWAEGHRDHYVRIRTELVTGRRLTRHGEPGDPTLAGD